MDIEAIFNQRKHSALYNTSYPIAPTDWSAYRVADAQLPFEEDKQLSFYVHITFCNKLCSYCEYSRILCPDEATQTHYLNVVHRDINRFLERYGGFSLLGFDIGGGTPTALTEANFSRLMQIYVEV